MTCVLQRRRRLGPARRPSASPLHQDISEATAFGHTRKEAQVGQRIGNLWIPEVDRKPKERDPGSKLVLELAPEVSQADLLRLGVLRFFLRSPSPHITREVWQCPRCGKSRARLYWLADGSVGCRTDEPGMAYLSERDLRRASVAPERVAELVKRAAETTNPSMRKKRLSKAERAAEEYE